MIPLSKHSYAITEHRDLIMQGPIVASDASTVTIKVDKVTGARSRLAYPVALAPKTITVAKVNCDLYR